MATLAKNWGSKSDIKINGETFNCSDVNYVAYHPLTGHTLFSFTAKSLVVPNINEFSALQRGVYLDGKQAEDLLDALYNSESGCHFERRERCDGYVMQINKANTKDTARAILHEGQDVILFNDGATVHVDKRGKNEKGVGQQLVFEMRRAGIPVRRIEEKVSKTLKVVKKAGKKILDQIPEGRPGVNPYSKRPDNRPKINFDEFKK